MEQIVRKDGQIFYGRIQCLDADEAYCLFRDDYHRSIGKRASYKLDRLGQREERIHGYGFSFSHPVSLGADDRRPSKATPVRLLGIVDISYYRIVGCWEWPDNLSEQEFERWLDWAFTKGSGALRLIGKKDKAGRTSKRLKTRYR